MSGSDFHCPGLLVAHSHAEDILAAFTELYGGAKLPAALRTGMTEGKILKHYLLLHDSHLKPPGGVPWYPRQSSESDTLTLGELHPFTQVLKPVVSVTIADLRLQRMSNERSQPLPQRQGCKRVCQAAKE